MVRWKSLSAAFLLLAAAAANGAYAQDASGGGASTTKSAPDGGPHPELDPDTDYAYWCRSTLGLLIANDFLKAKNFGGADPNTVLKKLDQRIGNVELNLEQDKVKQILNDYDNYYLSDTVMFQQTRNLRDLRKDFKGCRVFF